MEINDQAVDQIIEKKSKLPYVVLAVAVLLLGVTGYMYFSAMSDQITYEEVEEFESEDFFALIDEFGEQMNLGQYDEALTTANQLLAISDNDIERGRANLSIALAERQSNVVAATERFKVISRNEMFHPFVRAMAIWYTVEMNLGSRDTEFARDHIYTGDVWNEYVDTAYSDNPELMYRLAGISALRASLEISITAQAAMRLAVESVSLLQYDDFSDTYKEEVAQAALQYIALADQELVEIRNQNVLHYTGTEFVTITSALNSKALALDALFTDGYITDAAAVTDAYQDALEAAIAYDLQTSHPFFIRYNYADFLARTDVENSSSTIVAVLSPMSDININSSFAGYLYNRMSGAEGSDRSPRFTGHPQTMRQLAGISTEFAVALRAVGLTDSDLLGPDAGLTDAAAVELVQ